MLSFINLSTLLLSTALLTEEVEKRMLFYTKFRRLQLQKENNRKNHHLDVSKTCNCDLMIKLRKNIT